MRAAANIVVALLCTLPSPLRADWIRILPGPSTQVVANAGYAVALRAGEVWMLRDDGSVVGRLNRGRPEGTKPDRGASQREAEGILDYFDVAEADRDEDWARDLLYDQQTLAQRRRARTLLPSLSAESEPLARLAAGAGSIWIVREATLLHIDVHGEVIRDPGHAPRGHPLLVAGDGLAVGRPDGIHLLSKGNGPERVLSLPPQAEHVVFSASGNRWAYRTGANVVWVREDGDGGSFVPESSVVALAYCGESLVIMLEDALVVVADDGKPEVRNRAFIAKRFYCPDGESGAWLASGRRLQISSDQGRRWRSVETPAGVEIAAVAATAHHLWLATSAGLFYSAARGEPMPHTAAQVGRYQRRRGWRGSASWLSWLPQLSLRATAAASPTGHQLEALAYATIPLNPRRLPILAAEESGAPIGIPSPPRAPEVSPDMHDPDRHCLTLAKRKAVELALSEPERAKSYISRAGRAAWLPELRLLVSRRYGRSESLDITTSSTALASPLGIDTVNDIRYEARATWDLAKLVFSTEELAAQNQAMRMAELRREIESTMNRLYYERRRLVLEVGTTDTWARHLRADEISSELDSLAGGAFGDCTGGSQPGGR